MQKIGPLVPGQESFRLQQLINSFNTLVDELGGSDTLGVDWEDILNTPTSVAGYGIDDILVESSTSVVNNNRLPRYAGTNGRLIEPTGITVTDDNSIIGINVIQALEFQGTFTGLAEEATKLATPREIWGQLFDGTANVTGALSNATTGTFSTSIDTPLISHAGTTTLRTTTATDLVLQTNNITRLTLNGSSGLATFANDVIVNDEFTHLGVLTYLAQGTSTDQRAIVGAGTGAFGAIMTIRAPNGYGAGFRFNTGTDLTAGLRWQVYKSGNSEAGSNAGSALLIRAYSDSGTQIGGDVLNVTRAASGTIQWETNRPFGTGPLTVTGALAVSTNATITGNLTVNGNTTIGNATSDTLFITARLATDLDPSANNTLDLGDTALRFKDGWFAGTLTAATLSGALAYTNLTFSGLTAGQVLRAATATTVAFGALDLANTSAVTGTLPNANTTATDANTASTIVSRDASGNFAAGTITAALVGNVTGNADTATTAGSAASVPWSGVTSTPTTIAGYGITDFVSLGDAEWVRLDATSLPASIVSSSLTSVGTLSAGAVPASLVTAGTFGAGAYTFPSTLTTSSYIALNTTLGAVADSGSIRMPSNTSIQTRNTAGTGNIVLVRSTNTDTVTIGTGSTSIGFDPGLRDVDFLCSAVATVGSPVEPSFTLRFRASRWNGGSPTDVGLRMRGFYESDTANAIGIEIINQGATTRYFSVTQARTQIENLLTAVGNATIGGTLGVTGSLTTSSTADFLSQSATSASVNVGTGTGTGSSVLRIRGAHNQIRQLAFRTGNVDRWLLQTSTGGESSGNAGTNLSLLARADDGSSIDTPLSIIRASGGAMTLARPLTFSNYSGTGTRALVVDASGVVSAAAAGTGDVVGPASATDNAIVRFDGTTGKLVQDSAVTISDSGELTQSGEIAYLVAGALAGQVYIGDGSAIGGTRLSIRAPAASSKFLEWASGTGSASQRWRAVVSGGEAGFDSGGNWSLISYSDAGTSIDSPLSIVRAAGGAATWARHNIFPAATTSIPSIRVPHGTAPSSPTNGDYWTDTGSAKVRINGVTHYASWARQAAVADATGAGDVVAQLNDLLAKLRTINVIAT